jgi:hypothetical protein
MDLLKLYIQACMESFQWRSAHGKLYARRDLVRFNYIQEANCIYCYKLQQTIEHLYTECGRTQILFKKGRRRRLCFTYRTKLISGCLMPDCPQVSELHKPNCAIHQFMCSTS